MISFFRHPPLLRSLIKRHGLRRRTWSRRTPRTPPYAACFNIPKYWWEGDFRGHILTFWNEFKGDRFSGDVLLGAFESWHNYGMNRHGSEVSSFAEDGGREGSLPSVQALAAFCSAESAIAGLSISFKGLKLNMAGADESLIVRALALAATALDELLRLEDPPLLKAVEAGDAATVGELLRQSANPNEYGTNLASYGREVSHHLHHRPLFSAIRRNDPALTELLLRHGATWRHNPGLPVWVALENRAHEALDVLLRNGIPTTAAIPFSGREDSYTPIEHAARLGDLRAVEMLLARADSSAPFPSSVLRSARWLVCGPQKRELHHVLVSALERARQAEAKTSPPRNWRAVGRTVASQAVAAGLLAGGIYGSGESPRIAIYGFFFSYLYQLPTLALLHRWMEGNRPGCRQLAERITRRPHPNRPSFPVTVSVNSGPMRPGGVGAYLVLMAALLGFTLLLVNAGDQRFTGARLVSELGWGALMGLVWWLQDIYDRRWCLKPGESLPTNLGYNSGETTTAALTVLTGGVASGVMGNPWPYLLVLLAIRHLLAIAEDLQWNPDECPVR